MSHLEAPMYCPNGIISTSLTQVSHFFQLSISSSMFSTAFVQLMILIPFNPTMQRYNTTSFECHFSEILSATSRFSNSLFFFVMLCAWNRNLSGDFLMCLWMKAILCESRLRPHCVINLLLHTCWPDQCDFRAWSCLESIWKICFTPSKYLHD